MKEEINNYRQQIAEFNLQKSQQSSIDKEHVTFIQNDNYEQYQLRIHREEYSELDILFQHLYSWIKQTNESNIWQINLIKPTNQVKIQ